MGASHFTWPKRRSVSRRISTFAATCAACGRCWYWQPPQRPKYGHSGFDALGRRLQNPQRARVHHTFLPADFFHFGALAGQNARRKNRVPGVEAQRLAAVNQLDR